MKPATKHLRCAIYTRVSTEHGLEQEFNSLDNQREAAEDPRRVRPVHSFQHRSDLKQAPALIGGL